MARVKHCRRKSPPIVERIEVDTPPPSPVLFTDDLCDLLETQEVISPIKRVRTKGGVTHPKRRKTDNVSAPILDLRLNKPEPVTEDRLNEPALDEDSYGLTSEFYPVGEEFVRGYDGYIVAMAEQLVGFYPLSSDLYVVQGWDERSNCIRVGIS